VLNRLGPDGRQQITTLPSLKGPAANGDIVLAGLREAARLGGVELIGDVRAPGLRSLTEAPTMRDLLGEAQSFEENPYLLFGVIERTDPRTRARVFMPFSPEKVLYGEENIELQSDDRVILFGRQDIQFLSSNAT